MKVRILQVMKSWMGGRVSFVGQTFTCLLSLGTRPSRNLEGYGNETRVWLAGKTFNEIVYRD